MASTLSAAAHSRALRRATPQRFSQGRACYNLGNVHHAIGKSKINAKDPHVRAEGRKSVQTVRGASLACLRRGRDLRMPQPRFRPDSFPSPSLSLSLHCRRLSTTSRR